MVFAAFFTLRKLIIALGIVLAYVFGSPLLILSTFRQDAHPKIERIGEATKLPTFVGRQFDEADEDLHSDGFQLEDTLFLPQQTDNMMVVLRLYTNRDAKDSVIVVTVVVLVDEAWQVANQYCEFSSHFRDGSDFNTNNSLEVGAFRTPKNTVTTRAPWIAKCSDLYQAHCLIMQTEAGDKEKELRLVTKFDEDAVAFLKSAMEEEMENAQSDGYITLAEDGDKYVATFTGAYKMAWGQLWPFKGFVVAASDRKCRARLERAGFIQD